jgi:hypothetical protein
MLVSNITYADDAKSVIAALTERLTKIGVPKIEGSDKAGADKTAPALYFGSRKVNNNYDVVDDIKKTYGATATVFVLDGQEFVRVSTNVLTPEGSQQRRAVLRRRRCTRYTVQRLLQPVERCRRQGHRCDLRRIQEVEADELWAAGRATGRRVVRSQLGSGIIIRVP